MNQLFDFSRPLSLADLSLAVIAVFCVLVTVVFVIAAIGQIFAGMARRASTRDCPTCFERVKRHASKCKHCGELLPETWKHS